MDFSNITPENYTLYTGLEAPTNFERLKVLSIAIINRYNLNDVSVECMEILENAIYEQILYFVSNRDFASNRMATSKRAGNGSVSYEVRSDWEKDIAPMTETLLSQSPCNFNYRGLSVPCCQC